jgi:hypothetical protein
LATAFSVNAAPPKIFKANLLGAAVALSLATAAGLAMVFFFNPSAYDFYPICQFHRLTGLNCPGCGGTRALYALLHGNFSAAFRDNALFVCGSVFFGLRGGWFALRKYRGQPAGEFFPSWLLWSLLFVALGFTVLRNLPAFAFLSP